MKRILFLLPLMVMVALVGCTLSGNRTIPVEYSTEIMLDEEVLGDWEMRLPLGQPNTGKLLVYQEEPYQVMVIKNGEISIEDYPEEEMLEETYPNEDAINGNYDKAREMERIFEESQKEEIAKIRENGTNLSVRCFPVEYDSYIYAVFAGDGGYYIGDTKAIKPFPVMIFIVDVETQEPVYAQLITVKNYDFLNHDSPVLVEPK